MDYYIWAKVAHIISVISWMVALLYLPRLFVYHSETEIGSESSETFKVMERRLLKGILTPSMIASWIFGILLVVFTNSWADAWFVLKFFFVFGLTFYSFVCVKWQSEFKQDLRKRSSKFFRVVNEIPAVIMVFVIILVVVKPFS